MIRIATTTSLALALAVTLTSCAELTPTRQRATMGTLAGKGGDTAIGALAGHAGMGAGIGAGVGLRGGLLYDHVYETGRRACPLQR